eukprot:5801278-Pyramimonas_sp.AAC.1
MKHIWFWGRTPLWDDIGVIFGHPAGVKASWMPSWTVLGGSWPPPAPQILGVPFRAGGSHPLGY